MLLPRPGSKRWRPILPICCFCVLASGFVVARGGPASDAEPRTGTIVGRVIDRGRAVPFAIVSIPALWISETTAEDGSFRMTNVPAGKHRLRVQLVKGRDFRIDATVVAGLVDTLLVESSPPPREMSCPRPTPECTRRDARQHRRIGRPCERHPWIALVADTVLSADVTYEAPGFFAARGDSFPNANVYWEAGPRTTSGVQYGGPTVFGGDGLRPYVGGRRNLPVELSWVEVACCGECRAAQRRFLARAPGIPIR
jgi:hypothetical protein